MSELAEYNLRAEVRRARAEAFLKLDLVKCRKTGGHLEYVGLLGLPSCVLPYPDAGRPCFDTSECRGACRTVELVKPGTPGVVGRCDADTAAAFGCSQQIVAGVAQSEWCVD